MPEAPDLEVVKEFLNREARGRIVESSRVLKPTVLRCLTGSFPDDVTGRTFQEVHRKGKVLLMELSGDRWLAVNPMLTGALQFCEPGQRVLKKTCLAMTLSGDRELRYLDDRQMGKVYYAKWEQLPEALGFSRQGPDVLDEIAFEEFQERLRRFHGEIKGVLTRGAFVAGVGNAYADEILFAAGISPFRKTGSLKEEELRRLQKRCRSTVEEAIAVLRERMGDDIHLKIRDFLKVHRKGGQPCTQCGGNISELTANQRITSYCRRCQPGMLIRN